MLTQIIYWFLWYLCGGMLVSLVALMLYNTHNDVDDGVVLLIVLFYPIILLWVLIKYVKGKKKSYSKVGEEFGVSKMRICKIVREEREKFSEEC